MRANLVLQIIFAFFLGLVVVAFVGIGVNTFYPEPDYPTDVTLERTWQEARDHWALVTSIVLLVCATVILAISVFLPERQAVLSNGILLGGVFTMGYAVGMTFGADNGPLRFGVVALALAVTVAVGYLTFVRGRRAAQPASSAPAGAGDAGELGDRVAVLERRLDALSRALRE